MSTPTTTDGLVRTLDDVAAIATEAGLSRSTSHPTRWVTANKGGGSAHVHCWPSMAFQVAVYAITADGQHTWSAIFDYETPAAVILATIQAAQGGAA